MSSGFQDNNATSLSEGTASLFPVSNTGNPEDKVITIQSQYPWQFNVYDSQSHFISQFRSPIGEAPLVATQNLAPWINLYPAYIQLEILDGASLQQANYVSNLLLVGGDVFKIIVTYPPPRHEFHEVLLNSAPFMTRYEDLWKLEQESSDLQVIGDY